MTAAGQAVVDRARADGSWSVLMAAERLDQNQPAGAVPLVFGAAGPAEIVRDGHDGIHWATLDALADATVQLATDAERREALSASAIERSRDFSADAFTRRLNDFVAADR